MLSFPSVPIHRGEGGNLNIKRDSVFYKKMESLILLNGFLLEITPHPPVPTFRGCGEGMTKLIYFTSSNSTSKINVAPGGIAGGAPL
jgi:hypothetical protein